MSDSGDGDPEISRIFTQKVDRRFQRDFGRLLHQQQNPSDQPKSRAQLEDQRKNLKTDIQLIEAKETIELLRRQLGTRNGEIERLKRSESAAKEKSDALQEQLQELKLQQERSRRTSRDFNENKVQDKMLLDCYRTALSKYTTWMQFASNQLVTMKTLLEEMGGWTEANRYKIYFSYRGIQPEMVTDENVHQLSSGSIMDYPGGIENIESITGTPERPKFRSALTQTEADENSSVQRQIFQADSKPSAGTTNNNIDENANNSAAANSTDAQPPSGDRMSVYELRVLDCERHIDQLECQNARMREQLIILSDRAKHVELLEEQKQDLQAQLAFMRRQNDQLIVDHEKLKSAFGGGAITRNSLEELVRGAEHMKHRNQELEQRVQQLEEHKERLSMAESRRIAQIFKQKYEQDLAQLRERLTKYEPMHESDTTRIFRFAQHNPLDEAHDEHMVKQVVATAAAGSSNGPGSGSGMKRRRMEANDDVDGNTSDLTFLAEDAEDGDPSLVRELRLQLVNVKQQLEQGERGYTEQMAQYRGLVAQLCGYDIRMGEEGFCEVENVLSKDCCFLFQKQQPPESSTEGGSQQQAPPAGIDLLDNECAQRWKDVLDNYLVRYHSVPAFLSAVTISLVESPETPQSSSQRTPSIVMDGDGEEEEQEEEEEEYDDDDEVELVENP